MSASQQRGGRGGWWAASVLAVILVIVLARGSTPASSTPSATPSAPVVTAPAARSAAARPPAPTMATTPVHEGADVSFAALAARPSDPQQFRREAEKDPRRGKRWEERLLRIDARAREELGIDASTAESVLQAQRKLRAHQQGLRDKFLAGELAKDDVARSMRQHVGEMRGELARLLGPAKAEAYIRITQQEHAAGRRNGTMGQHEPPGKS